MTAGLAFPASSQDPDGENVWLASYETVWRTVNKHHFDPTFGGLDWRAIPDRYHDLVAGVTDNAGFVAVANRMLGELEPSHCAVFDLKEDSSPGSGMASGGDLGLATRLLQDRLVITSVQPASPAAEAGLRPGYIVESIGGNPGTPVSLTCLDERDAPREVTLLRRERPGRTILSESLPPFYVTFEARRIDDNIGYVTFSNFLPSVDEQFEQTMDSMRDVRGVIPDHSVELDRQALLDGRDTQLARAIEVVAALGGAERAAAGNDRLVPRDAAGQGEVVVQQGYRRSIAGRTLLYHSPLPGQREALLVRAQADWPAIVWETEALRLPPAGASSAQEAQATIRLGWLAGLGCNLGQPEFRLEVDGIGALVFRSVADSTWHVAGEGGLALTFHSTLRDLYGDRFGLMLLDVPRARAREGQHLTLRITGSDAQSQAWVMTFEEPLTEGVVVSPVYALVRRAGGLAQPVDVSILHLGETTDLGVRCPGCEPVHQPLRFGFNSVRVELPPAERPRQLELEVERGGRVSRHPFTLEPVRPWTVSLVQHTHTDIGYTRPQTEILSEHLRYIDYALDYCDATDAFPEEARFRWTCEVAWPVAEYLRARPPAQIERLRLRVREGRIELTAMPLNLGEVVDENVLRASLALLAPARANDLPVRTAMQNDVNGIAWCLIDYFHDLGIDYVAMGEHTHRALEPFDRPTPFWWESPAGNRVLAFRADHYMTANFWGILSGDPIVAERDLTGYLENLVAKGYPYDEIAVQFSGYFTDNAPPSTVACDFIRRWNETYAWPHLRTETMGAYLERIERAHGGELPVYRAAWPDWWTDGFGSAMRETAALRRAQSDLIATQGLLAMAGLMGTPIPPALLAQADGVAELLLFANEHTFGAAESVRDPLCENSVVQWMEKASYVWQAVMRARLLREGALGLLQPHLAVDCVPTITVFNTLNGQRSGVVTFFADHELLPSDGTFEVLDEERRAAPIQGLSARAEGTTWALWAEDVPPLGWKTYRVRRQAGPASGPENGAKPGAAPGPSAARAPAPAGAYALENDAYRLVVDPARGGITQLLDKQLGIDLLDVEREHALGQVIYERLDDRASMERRELGGHRRVSWSDLEVEVGQDGPLWQSLLVRGRLEGFDDLRLEIRLYKTAQRIELVYQGRKQRVMDPEAVYVALPFDLPEGHLEFEAQGGAVVPGVDQLPGTASDWNTIQAYAAVRSPRGEIVLVSEEAPLVQFGGINTGRYAYEGKPASNQIYSWVLNNYWVTNFCASQEGDLRWSYQISSTAPAARGSAARIGWGVRVPLVARVLPAGVQAAAGAAPPHLDLDRPNLLLVGARPARDGRGVVLHLREIGGEPVSLEGCGRAGHLGWQAVNALEEEAGGALSIPAFGARFLAIR